MKTQTIALFATIFMVRALLANTEVDYLQTRVDALEAQHVQSLCFQSSVAMTTIKKAQKSSTDSIARDHATLLRGYFLELVMLHSSESFSNEKAIIRKRLDMLRNFINDSPSLFIDQDYLPVAAITSAMNNAETVDISLDKGASAPERNELQKALDYVRDLPPIKSDKIEQGAAANP